MRFFIERGARVRFVRILAVAGHHYSWFPRREILAGAHLSSPVASWSSLGRQTADDLTRFVEVNPQRLLAFAEQLNALAGSAMALVEGLPELQTFFLRSKTTMKIGVPKAKLP